ncbi:MAG: Ppx/GppA phosphatase family protein [Methanoregula sp.]|nr:MAG: Ppx/GppA phosphatase family protein [Methanoregula sp.]
MKAAVKGTEGHVVGFVDIGTNSVRLLVVRFNPNHSFSILTKKKQQVQLGEGEFENEELRPEAIDRAVVVCKTFVELARTFACEEFVAVATSATREAANQNELLSRLRREAHLDVRVISGREEARLTYLGVATGVNLGERLALFIDIGGGSTELILGNKQDYTYLESLKLGSIRLTNQYISPSDTGPVSQGQYKKLQHHVKNQIIHIVKKVKSEKPDIAFGSSGTIMNLAEIAHRALHKNSENSNGILTHRDLKKVIEMLCALPVSQRQHVPGMNPGRADIIIAGAAIIDTLMKELGLLSIKTTTRGLQDGLLADYLSRMHEFPLFGELSPRQHSVLQLGRSCGINEAHARTVTMLALGLFDSAKKQKLHNYSEAERELLEYATFLHDVGSFISYTNHHTHSYYIIRNADLLGFNEREVLIIANIARFHRKKVPGKNTPELLEIEPAEREVVRVLSMFLRLAESLDLSHAALVQGVRFVKVEQDTAYLEIVVRGDCQLEIWGG